VSASISGTSVVPSATREALRDSTKAPQIVWSIQRERSTCQSPGTSRGLTANSVTCSAGLTSRRKAASCHLATFTLKVTVLAPPVFVMTNLYCASFVGVTLTEHFGPGESSLATSAPEES
jgi:hypothetical protein